MAANPRISTFFLGSLLFLSGLFLVPLGLVRGETSYHKLKKRLRKVEYQSGRVIGQVSQVMAIVAIEVLLSSECSEDDGPSFYRSAPAKSKPPASTPHPTAPRAIREPQPPK